VNPFRLETSHGGPPTVLCLGAHCDDIEIGCGGTLVAMREARPDVEIRWVVFSSNETRREETRRCARLLLGDAFADAPESLRFESFRDGYLPYEGVAVKDAFEDLKQRVRPDLILTHFRHDLHQDHRLVCELTWNTWRDHAIVEYEIPKYDGDLGAPNLFVPLTSTEVDRKLEALMKAYETQAAKQWFDPETFRGLMRLRGVEANAPGRYAEAFYARKLVLAP